jgi:DNA polymerase (family 10)
MVNNYQVAALFGAIGDMLEVKGESSFRYNAYREAARQLEALNEDLATLTAQGRLREIPGVGEAIAKKIEEIVETGQLQYFERLKAEVPPTLIDLLQIPGLGPRKIQLLRRELGIASIPDLHAALEAGQVRDLAGMGAKSEERLLAEVARWEQRARRTPIGVARPAAEDVVRLIQSRCPSVVAIEPAGSLRRWCDSIGDVDFVCAAEQPEEVLDCFVGLPAVKEVLGRGGTKASVLTFQNLQMDLRVVPPASYGAALQYFTGSKAHNVKLRTLAQRKGLTLNEYGLNEEATGRLVASATEEEIYDALGMAWIPPEMREDLGEIEAALRRQLPRLIEVADLRGELHAHSDWSDGGVTVEAMAAAAAERGLEYLAITDHSRSLAMTGGLSPERAREQWALIDRLNAEGAPVRLLKGIELEILPDGSLDLPDDVLAGFDIVIASVHSGFRQDRETLTRRLIAAARSPHVDVIGHPTGRIVGRRDAYEVDLDALLKVAAESGVAVEINANPARLDLDAQHARLARDLGVPVPINTDAHYPDNFDLLRYGVHNARRAWLEPAGVLNARPLADLMAWLRARGG